MQVASIKRHWYSPCPQRNKITASRVPCPALGALRRTTNVQAREHSENMNFSSSELSTELLISMGFLLAAGPALAENATAKAASQISTLPTSAPTPEVVVAPEAVDSAVSQIIEAVKAAGNAVKSGLGVAAQGANYVKDAADTAAPYVKKGITVATPYVKAGADLATAVAKPIVNAATPVVQSGLGEVEQFLGKQGLNAQSIVNSTRGVTSKAEEAINYASPKVQSTAGKLSTAGPEKLLEYALGLAAVYYLGPPILKRVFRSLRGFAGDISPAAALDAAATDGNAIIVDIRTRNDKEYAGIPDVPNSGRLVELEYASVSDRRTRNQLRNVNAIEKQMTVLQIASLKKVKKGTKVLLLDKNGGVAKDIAKALTSRGYKRVFVISGGFSGWTSSKLQTRGSSTVSAVEVIGPLFGGTRGSTARSDRVRGGRYLPSGR